MGVAVLIYHFRYDAHNSVTGPASQLDCVPYTDRLNQLGVLALPAFITHLCEVVSPYTCYSKCVPCGRDWSYLILLRSTVNTHSGKKSK